MSAKKTRYIRGLLMLTSVVFIGAGVMRGEVETVVTKAVNICLECIGIG